jgi:acetyltransferase-like isoleucine patch superfamily enzyme
MEPYLPSSNEKPGKNIADFIKQQNAQHTDVFLSYRSTVVDFAFQLSEELINNDITTWFDKNILHENVGDEYVNIIHQGIDQCEVFLLVYTKDIQTSNFILKEELGYAISKGKTIFLFPKDDVNKEDIPTELFEKLNSLQWVANKKAVDSNQNLQDTVGEEMKRAALARTINDEGSKFSIYDDINLFLIRIDIQRHLKRATPYGNYETLAKADDVYRWQDISITVLNKAFYIDIPSDKRAELSRLNFFTSQTDNEKKLCEINELKEHIESIGPEKESIRRSLYDFIDKNYSLRDEIFEWLTKNRSTYISMYQRDSFTVDQFIDVVASITADDFISLIKDTKKTMFNGGMTGLYDLYDGRTSDSEYHTMDVKMYYTDYFTFKCMVEVYHILRSIKDCFRADMIKCNVKQYAAFLSSLGIGGYVVINQDDLTSLMWVKRSGNISSGDMWHFSFDETSNICKDAVRDASGKIKLYEDNAIKLDAKHYMYRGIWEEDGIKTNDLSERQGIMEIGLIKSERLEIELLSYAVLNRPSAPSLEIQMDEYRHDAPDGYLEISKIEFVPLIRSTNKYTGRLITPEANHLSKRLNYIINSYDEERKDIVKGEQIHFGANVKIGKGTLIEDFSFIGDNSVIGDKCRIHRNVFVDSNVTIGNFVKIQNNNSIYEGVTLEDGVFVGTNVSFTNDRYPRAILEDGRPVKRGDWKLEETIVRKGASIGSGAVIRCGVTIGEWATIGCGAVVVNDVPSGATVVGNPAKPIKEKF